MVLSILFSTCALCRGAICTSPRGLLPYVRDCGEIAEAVTWLSRLPGENKMKAWGRGLPTTDESENVPKVYWLSGRGPTTCAIHVDVDAYNPLGIDNFRLSDVASAAEQVIAQCLVAKSKLGLAYPAGADGVVHAKVRKLRERLGHSTRSPRALFHVAALVYVSLLSNKADLENFVQIVRTDSPFELGNWNHSGAQSFAVPGTSETLQIATVHPVSNVPVNILRVD